MKHINQRTEGNKTMTTIDLLLERLQDHEISEEAKKVIVQELEQLGKTFAWTLKEFKELAYEVETE